jgi:signal transduction histidine kinase/CheY-like chemotaxis protein
MTDGFDPPVACLVLDQRHRIARANDECDRLLGRADLVGHPFAELLPVAARFFFQTHVYPPLERGERLDEVYVSLRTHVGDVPVVLNAVRRGDGIVLAFLPMHRRHLHERELVSARLDAARSASGESAAIARVDAVKAQLAIAERLASVGELAAAVAHEINNPLAYVSANVEILAADGRLGNESAELVSDLREGITRIRDIVASLKKLSRVDESRREPVDVARVIDVALKIAGAEIRHRARVEVHVSSPAPVVLAEEGRLGQVLINLLVNAAQALALERQAENRIVVEARNLDQDCCEILVQDNGPGIPPELQGRIFDPFFTTKPVGEGTGLGLSVCHGIVASLGGTIGVTSSSQNGTTFRIVLPALAAGTICDRPERPATPVPNADARGPRVLLIDDEEGVARSLRRVLRGCELTWCGSSRAAWERFEADGYGDFDVVLCDLMMPEMTGMDLYARIREAAPAVAERMVFLTGGAFTDGARRFLESVPTKMLTKPFDLDELRRVVYRRAS